jgi:hypothetical protein
MSMPFRLKRRCIKLSFRKQVTGTGPRAAQPGSCRETGDCPEGCGQLGAHLGDTAEPYAMDGLARAGDDANCRDGAR